ncbi:MAG: porin family protein [Chryseolinea sp.]
MRLKHTLLFILIILSSCFCHAQLRNFGVKGGLNVSGVTTSADGNPESKLGYHVALFGQLKLNDVCSIQPEIVFSNLGYKLNNIRYNLNYFALPMLFKYQYQNFFLDCGPQAAILFNANRIDLDKKEKKEVTAQFNNLDFSLVSGLGFMVSKKIGLEGRFILGLTEISNIDSIDIYNKTFQITVFYVFNTQPK